jgi:diguanylate cyclase (GGDEF)-like protein
MDGGPIHARFSLDEGALDRLMPLHLVVALNGEILRAGPTLCKLSPDRPLVGGRFDRLFWVRRPGDILSVADLLQRAGSRLYLNLRDAPCTAFRGIAVPIDRGEGVLLNLSFGIAVSEAVCEHGLTDADFAPTDLAVELLYLAEAKTAVMDELHDMNRRLQGAKNLAEEQALTDTLTGLRNRRALDQVLGSVIGSRQPFALMHIDLDFFKAVNDTLGHAAGDFVLQEVSHILLAETRAGDTVARVGGDEFVVIFPSLADSGRLAAIGNRIIDCLSEPTHFAGRPCQISASIGVAISSSYATPEPERMLRDADRALYASKRMGRARTTFSQETGP